MVAKNVELKQDEEGKFSSPAGHPRDRILIHENSHIPREGQFVALNGYAFLIKPGQEVDVPRPVRKMLDTRIRTETIQQPEGDIHKDVPRITYTLIAENVLAESSQDEAAASLDAPNVDPFSE